MDAFVRLRPLPEGFSVQRIGVGVIRILFDRLSPFITRLLGPILPLLGRMAVTIGPAGRFGQTEIKTLLPGLLLQRLFPQGDRTFRLPRLIPVSPGVFGLLDQSFGGRRRRLAMQGRPRRPRKRAGEQYTYNSGETVAAGRAGRRTPPPP